MTILLGINSLVLLFMAIIWSTRSIVNVMIKVMLFAITGANFVQFLIAMGYMVKR